MKLPHALPDVDTVPAPKTADCPACNGEGAIASADGYAVTYCERCDGFGRVAQAVADEWRAAHPP